MRVTKVKEYAEQAFFAAEAGFNRARTYLIQKGDPQLLNGVQDTLSYTDESGNPRTGGTYALQITQSGTEYIVVSTGSFGQGRYATVRVVSGRISIRIPRAAYNVVSTTYDP